MFWTLNWMQWLGDMMGILSEYIICEGRENYIFGDPKGRQ